LAAVVGSKLGSSLRRAIEQDAPESESSLLLAAESPTDLST